MTSILKILSVMLLSSQDTKHLTVLLTAYITVNTDIKTCMPQVSGLSKPDIIIQIEGIEDILCVISLLMMCPSIMLIGQNIYYSILMQDLATFIVPVNHLQKIKMQGVALQYNIMYPNLHPRSND